MPLKLKNRNAAELIDKFVAMVYRLTVPNGVPKLTNEVT
jgi:hypothetical protein